MHIEVWESLNLTNWKLWRLGDRCLSWLEKKNVPRYWGGDKYEYAFRKWAEALMYLESREAEDQAQLRLRAQAEALPVQISVSKGCKLHPKSNGKPQQVSKQPWNKTKFALCKDDSPAEWRMDWINMQRPVKRLLQLVRWEVMVTRGRLWQWRKKSSVGGTTFSPSSTQWSTKSDQSVLQL